MVRPTPCPLAASLALSAVEGLEQTRILRVRQAGAAVPDLDPDRTVLRAAGDLGGTAVFHGVVDQIDQGAAERVGPDLDIGAAGRNDGHLRPDLDGVFGQTADQAVDIDQRPGFLGFVAAGQFQTLADEALHDLNVGDQLLADFPIPNLLDPQAHAGERGLEVVAYGGEQLGSRQQAFANRATA